MIEISTSKAVLILWHFVDECKAVLDALREELRKRDYFPILFDFAVPANSGRAGVNANSQLTLR